jgi:hypothetical protein
MKKTLALLCLPVALGGLALAVHGGARVWRLEAELAETGKAGREAGASFVETLQGDHAERQRLAFDRRRAVALELAEARRDRLLGVIAIVAAGLVAGGLVTLSRLAAEVEEDRRHVAGG